MTDACEDLAVKEVVKLVQGAGLLRRRPEKAAARREEGGSTRLRIRDFSKCRRNTPVILVIPPQAWQTGAPSVCGQRSLANIVSASASDMRNT